MLRATGRVLGGLMGSGVEWSRFASNAVEQRVFAGYALFLSNFLRVD